MVTKNKLVVGNWKMNLLPAQAAILVNELASREDVQTAIDAHTRVVVCPPTTSMNRVLHGIDGTGIELGAQDGHHQTHGAYTGNVSMPMLHAAGCTWVIVGHSERRRYQHETNELIHGKTLAAQKAGITPIVCVGEQLEHRQANHTKMVIKEQLESVFGNADGGVTSNVVVAYEPVWAIGTGLAATPNQIDEVHTYISDMLTELGFENIPVLYGGSVTAENASEIFVLGNVHGALVGGASLVADSFAKIICA